MERNESQANIKPENRNQSQINNQSRRVPKENVASAPTNSEKQVQRRTVEIKETKSNHSSNPRDVNSSGNKSKVKSVRNEKPPARIKKNAGSKKSGPDPKKKKIK